MSRLKSILFFITIVILTSNCSAQSRNTNEIYIRTNQLGFLPDDIKTGVILSNTDLSGTEFKVINTKTNKSVYSKKITSNYGTFGKFLYSYRINFTPVLQTGKYFVKIRDSQSYHFKIGKNIYNGVVDSLMQFFKVQRSGYTNPLHHKESHIADATSLIENGKVIDKQVDLTGGWYDAGDYVKFLNTTAYTTYTLIFAYDFDNKKFGFDYDGNNVPDVLEEAKIGLDWLLRANVEKYKLITQVQDLRDHDVGWRLPEDDPLEFDRPAFTGIGKNLIGIYSATMALASRIWKEKFQSYDFAEQCLTAAENLYSIRNKVPDIDSSGTGNYLDKTFWGKLALGAVELYKTTNRQELLKDAKQYADSAGSDFWWSWGDINAYADYRLAKYDRKYADYIKNNLVNFNSIKDSTLFNKGTAVTWGTNNTLLGIALQNILWKDLTHLNYYDTLAVYQRDFVLGRNQWGVSFIYNIGTNFTKHLHHQIAFYRGGGITGGMAAGPASKNFLSQYDIPYSSRDKYSKFQTDASVYRDDRMDYITNEPTISATATAVFVFGYYSNNR